MKIPSLAAALVPAAARPRVFESARDAARRGGGAHRNGPRRRKPRRRPRTPSTRSPGRPATSTPLSRRPKPKSKPLFLYWGAVWCPPCNEVKATIFTRQDFIERARNFVPVYIDGDAKGAQKLGARFNVSGYPTMVLFTPDGREITRLPGEVEARPLHAGARARHERRAAGKGDADGGARQGTLATAAAARTGACSRGTRGSPTRSQLLDEEQAAGHAGAPRQGVPGRSAAARDAPRAAGAWPRRRRSKAPSRATTRPPWRC